MFGTLKNHRWLILTVAVFLPALAPAQTSSDVAELRRDVDAMKARQEEMQKSLQLIKDMLMGKQPPLDNVYISTAGAHSQGDPSAKVMLVEFSDYQCPFCGRYASDTFKKLIDQYVKTGKVRYVSRNFPLSQMHPLAEKAAEAAECAGEQGRFWEMRAHIFSNQRAFDPKNAGQVDGLDEAQFQRCMESGRFAAKVKADFADGIKVNVRGTPTFFFGYADEKDPTRVKALKLLSGAQPLNTFTDILDNLLNPPTQATN